MMRTTFQARLLSYGGENFRDRAPTRRPAFAAGIPTVHRRDRLIPVRSHLLESPLELAKTHIHDPTRQRAISLHPGHIQIPGADDIEAEDRISHELAQSIHPDIRDPAMKPGEAPLRLLHLDHC